nr:MAG TPA: hypothetical protein [Caudoviricetes sp.]
MIFYLEYIFFFKKSFHSIISYMRRDSKILS